MSDDPPKITNWDEWAEHHIRISRQLIADMQAKGMAANASRSSALTSWAPAES